IERTAREGQDRERGREVDGGREQLDDNRLKRRPRQVLLWFVARRFSLGFSRRHVTLEIRGEKHHHGIRVAALYTRVMRPEGDPQHPNQTVLKFHTVAWIGFDGILPDVPRGK